VTTIDIGALEDCPADISGNGSVDVDDVLAVVAAFGDCGSCDEDIDGDGTVGVDDLLVVIAAFGPC
jgi:hypothetical protein